jgi:hypothetical protein
MQNGHVPGRSKFTAESGQQMLNTLEQIQTDLTAIRVGMAAGDVTQEEALARALQGIQELSGVVEPMVRAYKQKFN